MSHYKEVISINPDESASDMSFDYKGYNGERKSLPEWVFHSFNKYGYDIGLQVRDKRNGTLRSSQKIYYEKGDKYKQRLIDFNPDHELRLYFNDGSKEQITL